MEDINSFHISNFCVPFLCALGPSAVFAYTLNTNFLRLFDAVILAV